MSYRPKSWGGKIRPDAGILPPVRTCLHCKREFQPSREDKNRKTCSNECLRALRVAANEKRRGKKRKIGIEPMRDMQRTCQCGEPIIRRNHSARYCIDCAGARVMRKKRYGPKKADV